MNFIQKVARKVQNVRGLHAMGWAFHQEAIRTIRMLEAKKTPLTPRNLGMIELISRVILTTEGLQRKEAAPNDSAQEKQTLLG